MENEKIRVQEADVPAIEIKDVVKVYKLYDRARDRVKDALGLGRKQTHKLHYALNGISMRIGRGETVGIIGTNGSGKSTILKIITGVLNPTAGEVHVAGRISALLELGAGFNMEYNGIENVYLNGTMMGFTDREIDEKLPEILEFADIGAYVNQPVKTYSSGMFVRLAFAVAINIEPEILIVDEALSVGDVFFQAKCYHKFEEFKKMGKTIVFVSHDLSIISKYCDRVFLLNQGNLLGEGSPKEMIDAYKRVLVGQYEIPEGNRNQRGQNGGVMTACGRTDAPAGNVSGGRAGESAGNGGYGRAGEPAGNGDYGRAGESAGNGAYGGAGGPAGNGGYGRAGEPAGNRGYGRAGESAGNGGYRGADEPAGNGAYGRAYKSVGKMHDGSTDGKNGNTAAGNAEGSAGNRTAGGDNSREGVRFRGMNPNAQEYGTRQAEILDCYVTDERGVQAMAILKGTKFTLHMRVCFHDHVPAPIFALSIKNVLGIEITGTNTMIEKAFLESGEPGQVKDITFTQKMTLQGGEYLLSLGVTGYNGDTFEVYHRLYDVMEVTVVSDKDTVGYYDMESEVTVTDAPG